MVHHTDEGHTSHQRIFFSQLRVLFMYDIYQIVTDFLKITFFDISEDPVVNEFLMMDSCMRISDKVRKPIFIFFSFNSNWQSNPNKYLILDICHKLYTMMGWPGNN